MGDKLNPWPIDLTRNYKETMEAFLKAFPESALPEKLAPWNDVIDLWRQIMKMTARNPMDLQKGIDGFTSVYNICQGDYLKLFNDWNKCLKRVAEASLESQKKGSDKEQMLKVCILSFQEFFETLMHSRYNLVAELIKAYFKYWQSFFPVDKDLTASGNKKT
jgi:hypothetical protein